MVCAISPGGGIGGAHHSPSSIFDMSKKFVLTGTLTQVEWVNPHIAVYIDAKKADGSGVENWKFESAPPSWLRRVGVNSADFKKAIGQTVTVEGNRAARRLDLRIPPEDHVRGRQFPGNGEPERSQRLTRKEGGEHETSN